MATLNDVGPVVAGLPGTAEVTDAGGLLSWKVKDKVVAWERPLRKGDLAALAALGEPAPEGPVLAVRVANVGVKEELVADSPDIYFTTPHFNGYPAVLVRLEQIGVPELTEILIEAWLDRAPKRLAAQYRESRG
jgi:hypothetical protein